MHTGCLSDIAYHRNVYEIKRLEIDKFKKQRNDNYFFIMMYIFDTLISFYNKNMYL